MTHTMTESLPLSHGKYRQPPILDAPPELAELVSAYVSARGTGAFVAPYYELRAWLRSKRGTIYVTDEHVIRFFHGSLHVGPRYRLMGEKGRKVLG